MLANEAILVMRAVTFQLVLLLFYMCMYVTAKVGGLARWAKAIATKPDDLVPGTCMVRDSILSYKLSSGLHMCPVHACVPINTR